MDDYMADVQKIIDKIVKQGWEYFYPMEHIHASNDRREVRLIFKKKVDAQESITDKIIDKIKNQKYEYDPVEGYYHVNINNKPCKIDPKDIRVAQDFNNVRVKFKQELSEFYKDCSNIRKEQKEMPPKNDGPSRSTDYAYGYRDGYEQAKKIYMRKQIIPKRIIYSNPVTVVFWEDGTKTIVRCAKGEKFNKYYGFCAALAKKVFETNSRVNKIVNDGIDEKAKKAKKDIKKSSDKAKKKSSEGKKK